MARKRKHECSPEEWARILETEGVRRRKNREKYNAKNRKWAKDNPDSVRKTKAKYRENHKETVRTYTLAWRNRNPEKVRAMKAAWRAKCRTRREAVSLFDQVLALIPAQTTARFDIAGEAMILLLEGKAKIPAEAVELGKRAHYRLFNQFDRKTVSLDQPLRDGRSLHELIPGEAA